MKNTQNQLVSIIILNWNGWEDTIECINSIKKITYSNYEIILVDNASSGDDVNILKNKFGDYIKIVKNKENYGFSKGNNIAIKQVLKENKSKYILLLNNDTVVDKNFLTKLINVAEKDENIAILGPKMYHYDYHGKNNVIWFGGGIIDWKKPFGAHMIGQFKEDNSKSSESPKQTKWISGACMLMNLKNINPLLNETYYFGAEDVDKCLNIEKKWKIIYVPSSVIWHKVGRSREKSKLQTIKSTLTNFKLIKNNTPFWMFIIPYYATIILTKSIIKNSKKLFNRHH